MPAFGNTSKQRLSTAHPHLQRLFTEVVKHRDCTVLFGHRGREEQEQAFKNGASKAHYGQSNHNYLPSLAVDVMPWYPTEPHIRWGELHELKEFAHFVLGVAVGMDIPIRWGGHFKNFFDGPHYELIGSYPESLIPQ
jgi:peptidoglycan LD-endopeptidase CwlK